MTDAASCALAQLETLQLASTGAHLVLPVLSESPHQWAWLLRFVDDCATHRVGVTVCVRSTVSMSDFHADLRQRQVPVVDVRLVVLCRRTRNETRYNCYLWATQPLRACMYEAHMNVP
jgi:hypothetical protein